MATSKQPLIVSVLWMLAGIFTAGMGIKGFLLSSRFIDGGITGVSMMLAEVLHWPLPLLIIVINLPFVLLGWRMVSTGFAVKSLLAILGLSLCLWLVPYPDVTPDKLLTAIFGGLFIGAGIGLAMRGGGVLDGTEVAALLISRGNSVFRVGDVILLLNIMIFLTAAWLLGIEPALYSILTYLAASRMVNFILHGIEEYTAVVVVSPHHPTIRQKLIAENGRSITVYRGEGGASGEPMDILYCVVTKLEIGGVKTLVKSIDPDAFILTHPLAEVEGGVIRKPVLAV